MDIIHDRCAGLDVHKRTVVACARIVTPEVKKAMKSLLNDIQDGSFAKKFIEENETGRHEFARIRKAEAAHPLEKVGAELRKAMPFLDPVTVEEVAKAVDNPRD